MGSRIAGARGRRWIGRRAFADGQPRAANWQPCRRCDIVGAVRHRIRGKTQDQVGHIKQLPGSRHEAEPFPFPRRGRRRGSSRARRHGGHGRGARLPSAEHAAAAGVHPEELRGVVLPVVRARPRRGRRRARGAWRGRRGAGAGAGRVGDRDAVVHGQPLAAVGEQDCSLPEAVGLLRRRRQCGLPGDHVQPDRRPLQRPDRHRRGQGCRQGFLRAGVPGAERSRRRGGAVAARGGAAAPSAPPGEAVPPDSPRCRHLGRQHGHLRRRDVRVRTDPNHHALHGPVVAPADPGGKARLHP